MQAIKFTRLQFLSVHSTNARSRHARPSVAARWPAGSPPTQIHRFTVNNNPVSYVLCQSPRLRQSLPRKVRTASFSFSFLQYVVSRSGSCKAKRITPSRSAFAYTVIAYESPALSVHPSDMSWLVEGVDNEGNAGPRSYQSVN